MAEPAMATDGEAVPDDDISMKAVLERFDGDAHAALAAALEDVDRMSRELQFANAAVSYGFVRRGLLDRREHKA